MATDFERGVADQDVILDIGVTGLTLGNITVEVWKQGAAGWGNSVNTNPDHELTETGGSATGQYVYKAGADDVNTAGETWFRAYDGSGNTATARVNVIPKRPVLRAPRQRPAAA